MRQPLILFFSILLIAGLLGATSQLALPATLAKTASFLPRAEPEPERAFGQSEASTSKPVLTPTQTIIPQSTPGVSYLYDQTLPLPLPQQVSFTYQGLAADVTGEIQLAQPYAGGSSDPAPDTAYPTHLRFYFYNDPADPSLNTSDIYIMNAECVSLPEGCSANPLNLTHNPPEQYSHQPVWSPDGQRLAFSLSKTEGSLSLTDLYVINAECISLPDGCVSNPVNLTASLTDDPWSYHLPLVGGRAAACYFHIFLC
jgi:hypothetical protein